MENASKALIMAGGVLIGILILSLAVYLFTSFGAESKKMYDRIESNQLTQFNAKYNIYADRKDLTIYEVISVANQANENNKNYKLYTDYETEYKIQIVLQAPNHNTSNLQDVTEEEKQEMINEFSEINDIGELKYKFECKVDYNSSGRVCRVYFKSNI